MKKKNRPCPSAHEMEPPLDTNGPVPRASGNGHVRPLIDDENDHERRQSGESDEWGSLFDRAD